MVAVAKRVVARMEKTLLMILFTFSLANSVNSMPTNIGLAIVNLNFDLTRFPFEVSKVKKMLTECSNVLENGIDCEKHMKIKPVSKVNINLPS